MLNLSRLLWSWHDVKLEQNSKAEITEGLLEAIRSLPLQRVVEHCGTRVAVSPFELYADCSQCGMRVKVRSFSAGAEVEDVFDAVFEWMNQPGAQDLARRHQEMLREDAAPIDGGPPHSNDPRSGRCIELD